MNARRRPVLMLYRHAVDAAAPAPTEVDVMGILVGGMRDIRCDICGAVEEWIAWRRRAKGMSLSKREGWEQSG